MTDLLDTTDRDLSRFIDDAFAADDTDAASPPAEPPQDVTDEDGGAGSPLAGAASEGDAPLPDDAPDDATPTTGPAATAPQQDVAQYQQALALAARELQASQERERQRAEAAQRAELQRLQQALGEMDPDERTAAQGRIAAEFARLQKQENDQLKQYIRDSQLAQADGQARNDVVRNLVAGNRLDQATNTWRRGVSAPLTAQEVEFLNDLADPWAMERAADRFVANRRNQTSAARSTLANQRRASGVDAVSGNGRGASAPAPPKFETVEDIAEFVGDGLFFINE